MRDRLIAKKESDSVRTRLITDGTESLHERLIAQAKQRLIA